MCTQSQCELSYKEQHCKCIKSPKSCTLARFEPTVFSFAAINRFYDNLIFLVSFGTLSRHFVIFYREQSGKPGTNAQTRLQLVD
jgi:hypothetical protein